MNRPRRRKSDLKAPDDFYCRFGSIAVRKAFVSVDQVKMAISDQVEDDATGKEHRLLGSILYDHGYITEDQIEQVLTELRKAI